MWIEIFLKFLPMIIPVIVDLFDKGPAACKLWGGKLDAVGVAAAPFGNSGKLAASIIDVFATTLKCCGENEDLCKQMAASIRENQQAFIDGIRDSVKERAA